MRVASNFFVGLVTHPRSRFPEACGPEGLAARLAAELRALGSSVDVSVINDDILSRSDTIFDLADVRASISTELAAERSWREYLSGNPSPALTRLIFALRNVYRLTKYAPPWRRKPRVNDPGVRMVTRLANIELAHLAMMRAALESHAQWLVILEDDAQSKDVTSLARDIRDFIFWVHESNKDVGTMNLSESFGFSDLGIEHLLAPAEPPVRSFRWNILVSARHVTNTVCAVLYRREFLAELVAELDHIPLKPVIPIDFKVNVALMRLDDASSWETWVCSPAPIIQGSGVPRPIV